jgi:NAD(P)-dependent dehydrogenase (short-subunit alcohol dehydrogenase family)
MNTDTANSQGVAIITGAAGGMGAAAVARLAQSGRPLILCDLDERRLTPIVATLRDGGCTAESLAGDIADMAFPAQLLAAVGDRDIGILIHTAGLSPTMADAARILAVNFDATARLVDAVRPRMALGGCAVLISSSSAHMVRSEEIDQTIAQSVESRNAAALAPGISKPEMAYPISKRAVIRLVAQEAAAFGARGARIVSISPGLIDTPMSHAELEASDQMKMLLAKTPLQRLGLADEIASVAVFLCSEEASYITGCDIRVDGGTLAALGM